MTAQLATLLQDALGTDYRLERELEAGGMSRLFLATDVGLNRLVVVKVLPPDLVSTTSIARFKREIELTVRLQHPHILPILTSGAWDDVLYYITPYMPGESLRARIARERRLPLDDILRILRDVSGALAFAHQRGIVHRDIKPGNILLADGHAILADFGIARAVSTAATPLTDSGIAPGTPAYMAPELPTDERADVYALGVVAYEMLCGELPERSVTARAIEGTRGIVPGDSRRRLRATALGVERCLSPLELRPTMAAVMTALNSASAETTGRSGMVVRIGVAAVAVALAIRATVLSQRDSSPTLDSSGLALFTTGAMRSERVQRSLLDALAEWDGIRTVSSEGGPSLGDSLPSISDIKRLARQLGVARIGVVSFVPLGSGLAASAHVYDGESGALVRSAREPFESPQSDSAVRVTSRRLVNAMLRDGAEMPWVDWRDGRRASFGSWRAYDRGRDALRTWDLSAAAAAFRESARIDPANAHAQLWLALTLGWSDSPNSAIEERTAAHRSIAARNELPSTDSILALATLSLADSDFVGSCNRFRQLIREDSSSVVAWIGLGECQRRDRVVLADPESPSGWRFRASYHAAASAYRQAASVGANSGEPRFRGWLFGRLSRVLHVNDSQLRRGNASTSDDIVFFAAGVLDHDTSAFIPYKYTPGQSEAQRRQNFGTQRLAFIQRNRRTLQDAAEEWVAQTPHDASALDTLATITELAASNTIVEGMSLNALEVARRARRYVIDSSQARHLAITEARLSLKNGDFERASLLADSLLRVAGPGLTGSSAIGLAAIVGRASECARLAAQVGLPFEVTIPGRGLVSLPLAVSQLQRALVAYSALGMPLDSVIPLATKIEHLLPSYVPDDERARQAAASLTALPSTLMFPDSLGAWTPTALAADPLLAVDEALRRRDPARARMLLGSVRRAAEGRLPGSVAIDRTYRVAVRLVALRDSAGAAEQLDRVLRALPTLGTFLFEQSEQAATLVRAMALRAELAAAGRDSETARYWATAVTILWRHADRSLQPTVRRMKELAGR